MKKAMVTVLLLLFSFCLRAELIIDDVGRKVKLDLPVKSVVSLSPGHTEMFYAIGADKLLVAVSSQCDYPPSVGSKVRAGSFQFPDVERIIRLKPDVVVSAGGIQKQTIKKLEKMGIAVIVFYPKSLDGIEANLKTIGMLTGKNAEAEAEAAKFRKSLEVKAPEKKIKVYAELWVPPSIAIGGSSYVNDVITRAGGENIFAGEKSDYPKINVEEVIKRNPGVILLFYKPDSSYMNRVYYKATDAGKNKRVYVLTKEEIDMALRPGLRIGKAVEAINALLLKTK